MSSQNSSSSDNIANLLEGENQHPHEENHLSFYEQPEKSHEITHSSSSFSPSIIVEDTSTRKDPDLISADSFLLTNAPLKPMRAVALGDINATQSSGVFQSSESSPQVNSSNLSQISETPPLLMNFNPSKLCQNIVVVNCQTEQLNIVETAEITNNPITLTPINISFPSEGNHSSFLTIPETIQNHNFDHHFDHDHQSNSIMARTGISYRFFGPERFEQRSNFNTEMSDSNFRWSFGENSGYLPPFSFKFHNFENSEPFYSSRNELCSCGQYSNSCRDFRLSSSLNTNQNETEFHFNNLTFGTCNCLSKNVRCFDEKTKRRSQQNVKKGIRMEVSKKGLNRSTKKFKKFLNRNEETIGINQHKLKKKQ